MQRLLLDTHVLLWWLADDSKLGPRSRALIADSVNTVYVSAVSIWEIGINWPGKPAYPRATSPARRSKTTST